MKKHILIITMILSLTVAISVNGFKTDKKTTNDSREITVTEKSDKFYILKDYKGRIALFNLNEDKPCEVFEIFTDSLPEDDAKKIRDGIVATEKDLLKLVSDYTS